MQVSHKQSVAWVTHLFRKFGRTFAGLAPVGVAISSMPIRMLRSCTGAIPARLRFWNHLEMSSPTIGCIWSLAGL